MHYWTVASRLTRFDLSTCASRKMRQPAGYVASIKTASSKHGVHGLGVRRKSSLKLGGQQGNARSAFSPEPSDENVNEKLEEGQFSDGQSSDEEEL